MTNSEPTDPPPEDEDFFTLFDAYDTETQEVSSGSVVKGKILSIGREFAFVDLGGKSEGMIAREELLDEDGELTHAVGEELEATVLGIGGPDHALRLSLSALNDARDEELLIQAFQTGIPVEGTVIELNKGGFEVRIGGRKAFCPISQIETIYTEDPSVHLQKRYAFLVTEYGEGGRKFVVSRAALQRREQEVGRTALRESLRSGDLVDGTVKSLRPFGAFVDLGGVDGLIHISEVAWGQVSDVAEILEVGQKVRVKVLEVDWEKDRIGLSMRQAMEDPWDQLTLEIGERKEGTVVRLADFGAFIEISPGIDGLLHISQMSWTKRVRRPSDLLTVGDHVDVQILDMDKEQKRISLGLKQLGEDPWSAAAELYPVGAMVDGIVDSIADFGVFVQLPSGIKALIPNREMGTDRHANHKKDFPVGTAIKTQVIGFELLERRLTLSRKALSENEGRGLSPEELGAATAGNASSSFGTFGDLLKEKLGDADVKE